MPNLVLQNSGGRDQNMANLSYGWVTYYFYSGVGSEPTDLLGDIEQDSALHRAYRDKQETLASVEVRVIGISSQSRSEQTRTIADHRIRHRMVVDPECQYARLLGLPVFEVAGALHYRRLALIARDQRIEHVFYPIEQPARSPDQILAWMRLHSTGSDSSESA